MFALPFTHFPLLISFISLVATLPVADNLFTDWTPSDLNDFSTSDSSSQFVAGDSNTDQLLAFNNDPSPNLFTSDSSTSDPLNQASADTSLLDTSNMFLDSTPLDSLDTTSFIPPVFDEQALPVLPSDLFSSDAISPDLLADNPSGGCSPPSSSRKSRKRESAGAACPSPDQENSYGAREEIDQAKKGFFDKSGAAQSEAYKQIVCPSAHFGAAVSIPVCSSPDPTMNSLMGQLSPTYPGSETLADSTLLIWWSASICVGGTRKPYCCQEWAPNVFMKPLSPSDPRFGTGTGFNCYDMFENPTDLMREGLKNFGFDKLLSPRSQ